MAAVRQIITEKDPLLREKAQDVRRFGRPLNNLLDDMKVTLYRAEGVGLAAPQIGISKRVVVVDDREHGYLEMINPVILAQSGSAEAVEFCLSVPERGGRVIRTTEIMVKFQDRDEREHVMEAKDLLARIFQHEIDHLDGRLFTDIMVAEVREEKENV